MISFCKIILLCFIYSWNFTILPRQTGLLEAEIISSKA